MELNQESGVRNLIIRIIPLPSYNRTITRENESKALSELSRDFDTGGTPAAALAFV